MESFCNEKTALLLVGFKRIDFILNRLAELKSNISIPIFISIDGSNSETESEIALRIKEFTENNPQMEISLRIQEKNMGLAKHITTEISRLLTVFDSLIVVEDDIVLSQRFVEVMLQGLRLSYKDEQVGAIAGFSGFRKNVTFDLTPQFRKSIYFPCWGWAISKKNWSKFELSLPTDFTSQLIKSQEWSKLSKFRKSLWSNRFRKVVTSNPHTWDYQMQYLHFKHSLKVLNTTRRIADNQGFQSLQSTNTDGKRPSWMGSLEVSSNTYRSSISKLSYIYELIDSLTIGGDVRLFKLATFIKNRIG